MTTWTWDVKIKGRIIPLFFFFYFWSLSCAGLYLSVYFYCMFWSRVVFFLFPCLKKVTKINKNTLNKKREANFLPVILNMKKNHCSSNPTEGPNVRVAATVSDHLCAHRSVGCRGDRWRWRRALPEEACVWRR